MTAPRSNTQRPLSERGSASVEMAVLASAALVLLFSVLQAGLWWHARSVCAHAAERGVSTARTLTGTSNDVRHTATDFLTRAPSTRDATVAVTTTTTGITVTVHAHAPRLIPGFDVAVTGSAHADKERFTHPGDP